MCLRGNTKQFSHLKTTKMIEKEELTSIIINAAIEVHKALGPGLMEKCYEKALVYELSQRGLLAEPQVRVPIIYKGIDLNDGEDDKAFRIDILVEKEIIIELKAVEELKEVHHKQTLTYLRLMKKRIGLLINFNVPLLKDGIHRKVNGY